MGALVVVALVAAGLLSTAGSATAQDTWGTVHLPGGASAARAVLDLGGDAGRIDEFLLVDFAHRFHGTPASAPEIGTFRRYLALVDQIMTTAATWSGGFVVPGETAPRADRDRAKRFLELMGLVLGGDHVVSAGKSADARERQAWLSAAGVETEALLAPLNAGAAVTIAMSMGELPLPLPAFWAALENDRPALLTITGSRESSLLYTGLLSVDSHTLRYLAAQPGLLTLLRSRHAAEFAAFARSIQVHDGRVVPAGGHQTAAMWEKMAGARLDAPEHFIPALLSTDAGRLAYFFDTVAHLDADRQPWILGSHAAATYDVFRRLAPKWRVRDQPFVRPDPDPLTVLHGVATTDKGITAAPWWPDLLDGATVLRDQPVDAPWLLSWVYERDNEAVDRYEMFTLAQRLAAGADRSAAPDLAALLQAVRDMPALPPALERMAVSDLSLIAEVIRAARSLDDRRRGDGRSPLARWQLMLALIEQVSVRQRLPPDRLTPLLRSWAQSAAAAGNAADGRAAEWLVDVLLPALAPDVATKDVENYERDVIVAISKRDAATTKVFWEGIEYVVDDTFATTRDVLTIRVSQSSPTLGDIVRLRRVLQRIEAGLPDLAQAAEVSTEVTRILSAAAKLRARDGREPKAVGEFRKADRAISDISNHRRIGVAAAQAPRLRAALDPLLEGTLLPLVYALAVSPAGQSPSSLLEMPEWHTWEKEAWHPAQREIGLFMESIIRGSVLGLDVAMADSRLRSSGRPAVLPRPAAMAAPARRAILHTMRVHGENPSWGTDAARILKALEAGDAVIAASGDIPAPMESRMRDAGIAPARIAIVRWQRTRGVPLQQQAFSRLDAYRLGTHEPLPAGFDGHATDVLLRLLETTRDLRVPAAIVPALLPLATHDWLAHVRQYGDDDVRSIREWARTLTRERAERYMLGLVSARILVQPARSQQP